MTVSCTVVECETVPAVPVIVSVLVAAGVEVAVWMVKVVVAPEGVGITVAGLKLGEAPVGNPDADKDTDWLNPAEPVKVTE